MHAKDPEIFWSRLLSGDADLIRAAWAVVGAEDRESVRRHLRSMAEEEGWQPGQREAARATLRCLDSNSGGSSAA
jgi:hypothetical protein